MTSALTDPLIGQTLDGRYLVRTKIARGGMATVYHGDDLRLGRSVAIKIMHAHLAGDEQFTSRFEQEARSAAGLSHPNVVGVFDQGVAAALPYLVMEHLPGITLRELLKQRRRLTVEEASEIAEAVLSGLAAAHEAQIVHRDLKPENVLLADDGRIKIGDFGLARAASAHTSTGHALLGTIAYLSPELVTRGIADARTDLYAFGIMLFEMLTGVQPYVGEQPMQIAYQHAHADVPAPSSIDPHISAHFDELVQWTTGRDPNTRPHDAREALNYLRALPGGAALASWPPPRPSAAAAQASPANQTTTAIPHTSVLTPPPSLHPVTATTSKFAALPGPAIARAQADSARRSRAGRWTAALLTLLIAISGLLGWWWQQQHAQREIADVAGLELAVAQELLEAREHVVELFECPSLDVAPGLAVRTEPEAGTFVERGGTVRLCVSTGPQLLSVPPLVGMPLEEATTAVAEARFTFGRVLAERFDGGVPGTVILALDSAGNGLGEQYPEQGVIDLIVSAGEVPDVRGLDVDQARIVLTRAGLSVDPELHTELYSDEVAAGLMLGVQVTTDPLDVGDTVGLQVSLGPELFEIPDVSELRMRQAIEILEEAGFHPVTDIPELLWGAVQVAGTAPAAGTWAAKGTTIELLIDL